MRFVSYSKRTVTVALQDVNESLIMIVKNTNKTDSHRSITRHRLYTRFQTNTRVQTRTEAIAKRTQSLSRSKFDDGLALKQHLKDTQLLQPESELYKIKYK